MYDSVCSKDRNINLVKTWLHNQYAPNKITYFFPIKKVGLTIVNNV